MLIIGEQCVMPPVSDSNYWRGGLQERGREIGKNTMDPVGLNISNSYFAVQGLRCKMKLPMEKCLFTIHLPP